jgi:hypothetical protein
MKRIIPLFFIIVCQSCMSYQSMQQVIPPEMAGEIPLRANKIIITNSQTQDENFRQGYKILLAQDYRIENDNSEMGYISASKKDFGDTHVRLNVVCEENEIQVTSEWMPGNQSAMAASVFAGVNSQINWENAQWNKKADKPSVAFANAVLFSKEISNDLKYITHEKTPAEKTDRRDDPIYR